MHNANGTGSGFLKTSSDILPVLRCKNERCCSSPRWLVRCRCCTYRTDESFCEVNGKPPGGLPCGTSFRSSFFSASLLLFTVTSAAWNLTLPCSRYGFRPCTQTNTKLYQALESQQYEAAVYRKPWIYIAGGKAKITKSSLYHLWNCLLSPAVNPQQ